MLESRSEKERSDSLCEARECLKNQDEVTIGELLRVLWSGKYWSISVSLVLLFLGVLYALNLPNIYQSEGVYAAAKKSGENSLLAQYGGLAAMAGLSLGAGGADDLDQAIAMVGSRPFLESIIEKHNLKASVVAVENWNNATAQFVWDEKIYNALEAKWKTDRETGESLEPSMFETYRRLSQLVKIERDPKSGLLYVSAEHYAPVVSRDLVRIVVDELNSSFQQRDVVEARKNIGYLESKINETSFAEMQAVFYGMIEAQMKTLMIAEVGTDYLLKEVVAPTVPELKAKPKRLIIILFFAVFGFCATAFFQITKYVVTREDAKQK